jgi:hypothetical protein
MITNFGRKGILRAIQLLADPKFTISTNTSSVRARQKTRFFGWQKVGQRFARNSDVIADVDEAAEYDHVFRPHPDATVAGAPADESFFGGAVNVDATVVGVRSCSIRPRSQITRETIASRPCAFASTISPGAFRLLITQPVGKPPPIFALTYVRPNGVR